MVSVTQNTAGVMGALVKRQSFVSEDREGPTALLGSSVALCWGQQLYIAWGVVLLLRAAGWQMWEAMSCAAAVVPQQTGMGKISLG